MRTHLLAPTRASPSVSKSSVTLSDFSEPSQNRRDDIVVADMVADMEVDMVTSTSTWKSSRGVG